MSMTLLCLRPTVLMSLSFPLKDSGIVLFPTKAVWRGPVLSVMGKSFPASAGRKCRSKRIVQSTLLSGIRTSRFTCVSSQTMCMIGMTQFPAVQKSSLPFPTIPLCRISSPCSKKWTSRSGVLSPPSMNSDLAKTPSSFLPATTVRLIGRKNI